MMSVKQELLSLGEQFGEYFLDSVLKDERLKDVPIVGGLFSVIKICGDIRDRAFVEKMKSFIENIERDSDWKEKFKDLDECERISKKLLYIVDSIDDDEKLKLIGMAFNDYVNKIKTKEELFYIIHILERAYYPYLQKLFEIEDERFLNDGLKYDYNCIAHLLNIGVLNYDGYTIATYSGSSSKPACVIVKVNEYANKIKDLMQRQMKNDN